MSTREAIRAVKSGCGGRSHIANKTATEAYFVRAGFKLINPEEITYEELVRQARNASMVAMYWGSAMTNMVYFKNNARVFLLKSPLCANDR